MENPHALPEVFSSVTAFDEAGRMLNIKHSFLLILRADSLRIPFLDTLTSGRNSRFVERGNGVGKTVGFLMAFAVCAV